MRKYAAAVLLMLLCCACAPQPVQTVSSQPQGKYLLSEQVLMWDYGDGIKEYERDTYEYNEDGNKSLVTGYMDGEVFGSTRFEYNPSGELTAMIALAADGSESWREEYTYSGGNRVLTVRTEEGSVTSTRFEYTDGVLSGETTGGTSGTPVTETVYDIENGAHIRKTVLSDGVTASYTEYINDDSGRCTDEKTYDASGKFLTGFTYEYSETGDIARTNEYKDDYTLAYVTVYEYEDGNTTRISYYDAQDALMGYYSNTYSYF